MGLRKERPPETALGASKAPSENHQKHFFGRWIFQRYNEISTISIWGVSGKETFENKTNDVVVCHGFKKRWGEYVMKTNCVLNHFKKQIF